MTTTRTFEPRHRGPITVDLYGYNSNMEVVSDKSITQAAIHLITEARNGPTIDMIDALRPRDTGDFYELRLPKNGPGMGGNSITISDGDVQVNSFGGVFASNVTGMVMTGRSGFVSTGGGDVDMHVGGKHIQVRGGQTFINGRLATTEGEENLAPSDIKDGPAPVHFRVELPPGSTLVGETYNGNITSTDVGKVQAETYNGDVRATGLAGDSQLRTYNGNITVGSDRVSRPTVTVKTYNGDITLLDEDMRVRPQTRNGNVRYPN
jgi:hypothetical protein